MARFNLNPWNRHTDGKLAGIEAAKDELDTVEEKARAGSLSQLEAASARVDILKRWAEDIGSRAGNPRHAGVASASGFTVLGIAAALLVLYFAGGFPSDFTGMGKQQPVSAGSEPQGDEFAKLRAYAQSVPEALPSVVYGPMSKPKNAAANDGLADVDTMIERLAARLEKEPNDSDGWRMLGWSYFQTKRFAEAEKAYAHAVALKPESTELTSAYEEAKAKAAAGSAATAADTSSAPDVRTSASAGPSADSMANIEALPADQRATMIRAMVDRLESRLETAPRDAEGWIRLMRSRTVLGEKDAAATALRKALEIFKDEPERLTEIATAANEIGVTKE